MSYQVLRCGGCLRSHPAFAPRSRFPAVSVASPLLDRNSLYPDYLQGARLNEKLPDTEVPGSSSGGPVRLRGWLYRNSHFLVSAFPRVVVGESHVAERAHVDGLIRSKSRQALIHGIPNHLNCFSFAVIRQASGFFRQRSFELFTKSSPYIRDVSACANTPTHFILSFLPFGVSVRILHHLRYRSRRGVRRDHSQLHNCVEQRCCSRWCVQFRHYPRAEIQQ